MENWVRLSGTALDWFKSYLKDRSFFVSVGTGTFSELTKLSCRIPQVSNLGSLLINIYMLPVAQIITKITKIGYRNYANDEALPYDVTR